MGVWLWRLAFMRRRPFWEIRAALSHATKEMQIVEPFFSEPTGKWTVIDDERVRYEFDDRDLADAFLAERHDEQLKNCNLNLNRKLKTRKTLK